MAEVDGGCIFLARKILESDIWSDKPAWWLKVWLYLLVRVNHTDKDKLKRGQGFFRLEGIREGCKLFDIKRVSIDNVIKWLKSTTQITTQKTTRGMIITICNYDSYQNISNYKTTQKTTQKTTAELHRSYTICKNERINKEREKCTPPPEENSPKEKNTQGKLKEKQRHGEYVLLSPGEYSSLIKKLGGGLAQVYIDSLDLHIGSKGTKYKSHYYTILAWHRRDVGADKVPKIGTTTSKDYATRQREGEAEYDYYVKQVDRSAAEKVELKTRICRKHDIEDFLHD